VNSLVNKSLDDYRKKISGLGSKLNLFTCEERRDYLDGHNKEIDFIEFETEYIDKLKALKKDKTAANFNTVKNSLIDFFRRQQVLITEIEVDMLGDWENFLRTQRTVVRLNQFKKEVITVQPACKDASVHNYMRDLRSVFNHARKKYNKKSLCIFKIEHYPFEEYEIIATPLTTKRNCRIFVINKIRSSKVNKSDFNSVKWYKRKEVTP
jgi:hypothetical protein